jgi:uncharacterized protein (TIGR00299 family) protein
MDPFSGIAGDMFLGALVDLGVSVTELQQALEPLPTDTPFQITAQRTSRRGIGAVDLKVQRPKAQHHHHHHTGYRDILGMIDMLELTDRGKQRAGRVLKSLAEAEARVHGCDIEKIHFHEVGAVDSIVDMLGSVVGLEMLKVDTLSCGPLPISRGFVDCAHGRMPVPAPATAYLMANMPTVGVDRVGELVTPTGAALVAGLCDTHGPPPPMIMQAVGYGAGDRDDPDVPNLLRLMLGQTLSPGQLATLTPAPEAARK